MSIIVGSVTMCWRDVGTLPDFAADTGRHRDRTPMLSAMLHNTTSPFARSSPGVMTSIDQASTAPDAYQTICDLLRVVLAARKTVAM